MNAQKKQEKKKVSIITSTDAIMHPRTVMIKHINAAEKDQKTSGHLGIINY